MRKRIALAGDRQRGAVAIIVALSLAVLIGFAGLALDLGHLYVDKTELQNAADACALAASRELTCDPSAGPCGAAFLLNSENAGKTVAARHKVNFQGDAIAPAAVDVKFYTDLLPNESYQPRTSADLASKYVMCTITETGIVPWFMQVLGNGNQTVSAQAVATLKPAQANCAIPIGLCKLSTAPESDPFAGLTIGQWVTSKLSATATGKFSTGSTSRPPLEEALLS